jgi:hypothetical protein
MGEGRIGQEAGHLPVLRQKWEKGRLTVPTSVLFRASGHATALAEGAWCHLLCTLLSLDCQVGSPGIQISRSAFHALRVSFRKLYFSSLRTSRTGKHISLSLSPTAQVVPQWQMGSGEQSHLKGL